MPGPIAPAPTPFTSTSLDKLGTAVPKKFVFQHIDLPGELSLGEMMSWLSKRMQDSDGAIRSKMASVNARKVQGETLTAFIEALRSSRLKNADAGDGCLKLEPPLDDLSKIRESDFYKSIAQEDRGPLDALLAEIQPAGYLLVAPGPWGPAGKVVRSPDELAGYGVPSSAFVEIPPRMNKDKFEDAIQNLGDMGKTLGSRDEMEMIQLQSAISARGQLLQMVSNMIASFNSTADKIVGNVR